MGRRCIVPAFALVTRAVESDSTVRWSPAAWRPESPSTALVGEGASGIANGALLDAGALRRRHRGMPWLPRFFLVTRGKDVFVDDVFSDVSEQP